MAISTQANQRFRLIHWIALAGCLALYALVRVRWLGHLLTWDEAMNICTTRSFVSGSEDYYSGYIRWHPPLLNVLWLMIQPLRAGFVARTEFMALAIGGAGLLIMTGLNARVFGPRVAVASALCLSLMPGAAYFSLWLKQDALVVPLGLGAILFFLRARYVVSGVCLGFAFLAKEMAIFYAMALALLWLAQPRGDRRVRDLAIVAGVCAIVSGWWYVFISATVKYFMAFATGGREASGVLELFAQPWYFFFAALSRDLGWGGMFLALAGLVALLILRRRGLREPGTEWPIALMVPAYLLISTATGKAAWFTVTLYVAWATLQGLGLCAMVDLASRSLRARGFALGGEPHASRILQPLLVSLAVVVLGAGVGRWGYEEFMQQQEMRMWWSSNASREAAQTLNRVVRGDERVLITPMYYYGARIKYPCPIFVAYLRDMPVLLRPNTMTPQQFLDAVRLNELHWAMVSPEPGEATSQWLDPLVRDHGLRPVVLQGAFVLHTAGLWARE